MRKLLSLVSLPLFATCMFAADAEVVAVAEQTVDGEKVEAPAPTRPAYFVEGLGGYIEAGFPIAGDNAPAPELILVGLRAALRQQGYFPATAKNRPTLVITYHWGTVRGTVWPSLVAPQAVVSRMRTILPNPLGAVPADLWQTREMASQDRYFMIVSAYRYDDVLQQTPELLWRTKVSIADADLRDDVWTTLARSTAPYLGRSSPRSQIQMVSSKVGPATPPTVVTSDAVYQVRAVERDLITNLTRKESDFLAGDAVGAFENKPPQLPPELAQQIRAYEQEKGTLQSLLRKKIKSKSPGPEFDRAIEAFDRENSARLAGLARMADQIRGELAKLAPTSVASTHSRVQPLDRLRQTYNSGMERLGPPGQIGPYDPRPIH